MRFKSALISYLKSLKNQFIVRDLPTNYELVFEKYRFLEIRLSLQKFTELDFMISGKGIRDFSE